MRSRIISSLVAMALALSFYSEACVTGIRVRDAANCEYNTSDPTVLDKLHQASFSNLDQYMQGQDGRRATKCDPDKAPVRKEWGALSQSARRAYIDAVLCLTHKPSQSDPTLVPGARNRYDDFVAIHVNQTLTIHGTANFLSWHRYFSWAFEQALRNECGYKGYLPYWNWGKYANDPESSPIFDGSEYSMSGNGAYVANRTDIILGSIFYLPPQNGGGCIKSGPFKDMKANLGPVSPTLKGVPPNPQANGLGYNPRCLKRDIGNYLTTRWTKTSDIASLIVDSNDIGTFQSVMQGNITNPDQFGVHSSGHFTIGGDPGGDFYTSPGDPAFFLHHGMIDYCWWIWQNLDPKARIYTIAGTITFLNTPPSRDGTLDDTINLGVIAPKDIKLRELMSTVDGPFCYVYE